MGKVGGTGGTVGGGGKDSLMTMSGSMGSMGSMNDLKAVSGENWRDQHRKKIIDEHSKVWLDALNAPLAGVYTLNNCVALMESPDDLGVVELVVADLGRGVITTSGGGSGRGGERGFETRIKVFQGNRLTKEFSIPDPASAISVFYDTDYDPQLQSQTPRSQPQLTKTQSSKSSQSISVSIPTPQPQPLPPNPILAITSGPNIYLYKSHIPCTKCTLPPLPPNPHELTLWNQLREECIRAKNAELEYGPGSAVAGIDRGVVRRVVCGLKELRDQGVVDLCARSLRIVALAGEIKDSGVVDEIAVSYARAVASVELKIEFQLSSALVYVSVSGLYDYDYHIIAACRDGNVYLLKSNVCKRLIQVQVPLCGLISFDDYVLTADMNRMVIAYNHKGQIHFSIQMPSKITVLQPITIPQLATSSTTSLHNNMSTTNINTYAISLTNHEIRIYNNNKLLSILKIPPISPTGVSTPASAIRFGKFGREENGCLIVLLRGGGLAVRILKRGVDLIEGNKGTGYCGGDVDAVFVNEDELPLPVPRRTRLYLEQTLREQEQGVDSLSLLTQFLCLL
ncbi:Bardet-Biedl syndrome 1 protein [Blyttiomyces sp. JEL0837]|nr:Bardet-Biedl syndrome 1 protein [Blyttiomyces sp. JEL0837]